MPPLHAKRSSCPQAVYPEKTGGEREPMADLYRVNPFGQMLDRYDALRDKGMNEEAALQRTQDDFADIQQTDAPRGASRN